MRSFLGTIVLARFAPRCGHPPGLGVAVDGPDLGTIIDGDFKPANRLYTTPHRQVSPAKSTLGLLTAAPAWA